MNAGHDVPDDPDGQTRPVVLASGQSGGTFDALSNRSLSRTTDSHGTWESLTDEITVDEDAGTGGGLVAR